MEPEIIDGAKCQNCKSDKGLEIKNVIATLPNILIVQLKRFNFNVSENRVSKVNSYFEFPPKLNLMDYTYDKNVSAEDKVTLTEQKTADYERINKLKDMLTNNKEMSDAEKSELLILIEEFGEMYNPKPDDIVAQFGDMAHMYNQKANDGNDKKAKSKDEEKEEQEFKESFDYKLVGITVQSGTLDSGHYWSYINTDRSSQKEAEEDTKKQQWMEFNDTQVQHWNFENGVKRCYGTKTTKTGQVDTSGTSAYLLFYERIKKNPLRLRVTNDNSDVIKAECTRQQKAHDLKVEAARVIRRKEIEEEEKNKQSSDKT